MMGRSPSGLRLSRKQLAIPPNADEREGFLLAIYGVVKSDSIKSAPSARFNPPQLSSVYESLLRKVLPPWEHTARLSQPHEPVEAK